MADTLKSFLVEIGFKVIDAEKAEAAVKKGEARVTAAVDQEGKLRLTREQFRQA